eukprot:g43421.t1
MKWYQPRTLEQLYDILQENPKEPAKFINGDTAKGVYKGIYFKVNIDVKGIPDLYKVTMGPHGLKVFSNVTLSSLIDYLKLYSDQSPSYNVIAQHLLKITNKSVQNEKHSTGPSSLAIMNLINDRGHSHCFMLLKVRSKYSPLGKPCRENICCLKPTAIQVDSPHKEGIVDWQSFLHLLHNHPDNIVVPLAWARALPEAIALNGIWTSKQQVKVTLKVDARGRSSTFPQNVLRKGHRTRNINSVFSSTAAARPAE